MKIFHGQTHQRGSLIIEVLLSIGFALVFSAALATLARANTVVTTSSRLKTQAVALARESLEQAYAMKREAWSKIAVPTGTYRIETTVAGSYELQPTATELIDGIFTRTIQIDVGTRDSDATSRLVSGGPYLDQQTRQVAVSVEWLDRGEIRKVNLSGYLTNWKEARP